MPAEHGSGEGVDEDGRHHVRIEPDGRGREHSGDGAEQGREPPAEREHPRDAHPDEPCLLGVDGRRAQREPDLRELEEAPEEEDDSERDGDRADVVRRDDDASDVVRLRPERALQLLRLAAPLPDDEAVDRDEEPDRDDDDPQDAPALDRPDDDPVDADAADERDDERRDERRPVAPAVVERERPGDVGRERRHLPLGEVDDPRRAVDDHEREREQRVDAARGEAGDDLLHEVREGGEDHQ